MEVNIIILEQNPSTIQNDTDFIIKLAHLTRIDYDRLRKSTAKKLGVQIKTLDDIVKQERDKLKSDNSTPKNLLFKEIKPWHESIELSDLLTELTSLLKRFSILPEYADIAIALWILFTWCIDSANTAPILAIVSPEKRCGKTTVLSLLNLLVKKPLSTSNVTSAALFRTIEEYKPTLLIDEADTFIKQSDDLRGILNSGHTKSTAFVLRTIGDEHIPKVFNTWGAKAIAMIGKLPDTLHDRSIVITLKRKLPHEKTERLYRSDYDFEIIKQKLYRFAIDYNETIKQIVPHLPYLSDRAADNWELLIAISSLASKEWESKAKAATNLSNQMREPKTYGIALLSDIKEIFESKKIDKIFSSDLITELCNDKEKPWASFRHGNPINERILANLLKEFTIVSKSIRIDFQNLKGYDFEQFEDAFLRYIPDSPILPITALQPAETKEYKHIALPLQNIIKKLSDSLQIAKNKNNIVETKAPKPDDSIDEYLLEERAAIMEYDGGVTKEEAEIAVYGKVVTEINEIPY